MILCNDLQSFESAVTGRDESLFDRDLQRSDEQVRAALLEASVLIIGAAGSIGGAFTRELVRYPFRALHLIDISENNLTELVRDLRSSGVSLPRDFATFALDCVTPEMNAYVGSVAHDFVFNFSALKHVRSERDPFTLMRMLMTNVIGNEWLMNWLSHNHPPKRYFCVSSDKAVRPTNLMGASKAFMERVLLSRADHFSVSSARFANVTYSDGSLLHSFNQRIAKRQPISAPSDVRRYFISHREAAQLCILAAIVGGNREIFYPKYFKDSDALNCAQIARLHLNGLGLEPVEVESDEEAIAFMEREPASSRRWACHFSKSDTSGEKECEEFCHPIETEDRERIDSVGIVTAPIEMSRSIIETAISEILLYRDSLSWTKDALIAIVEAVVPELQHRETYRSLDEKM